MSLEIALSLECEKLKRENQELKQALDAANKLIGHQADRNDKLVSGLNDRIRELESEVRFLERRHDESRGSA